MKLMSWKTVANKSKTIARQKTMRLEKENEMKQKDMEIID